MKALVIYDSKFGNTEQVAQAIADTLGEEGIWNSSRSMKPMPLSLKE